jgi:hypothetical protein
MSVSENVRDFLRACGFSKEIIDSATPQTRILHDLGQTGDDFLDTIEVLHTKFDVDLSQMDWRRYTPTELHWDSLVFRDKRVFGFFSPAYVERRLAKYEPVTLAMIEEVLRTKKWNF